MLTALWHCIIPAHERRQLDVLPWKRGRPWQLASLGNGSEVSSWPLRLTTELFKDTLFYPTAQREIDSFQLELIRIATRKVPLQGEA